MKLFEEIPHTADWSFRAFGRDLRELFANAAHAIFAMQGARADDAANEIERVIELNAMDREALFVTWLSELLWLQEAHREVYTHFEIESLSETDLRATAFGKPRVAMDKIIKAATYHNLKIEQTQDGWQAVVVVDV
ncbi:MAG: archease [Chloroflexi bacterium]|nr:archease [Chloroflexota bacterium]